MTGNDLTRAFEGFAFILWAMLIALIIFVPLGIWKLVEILIWLWNNVHISVTQ